VGRSKVWGSLRGSFAAFVLALLLSGGAASSAVAAECTTTWTGAAEGNWHSTTGWSAGKVPTASDVACIGTGKTVRVSTGPQAAGVVQGEGTLKVAGTLEVSNAGEASEIGALTMESGGTLTGAATVKVSKTFSWAKASTMSGSGATVLLPGATGSQTSVNETTNLKQREFLNEGTFTHSNGRISLAEGAVLRNAGTYNSNTGYEDAMLAGTGISEVVNTGTFQKTANINNVIAPAFENKGTVLAKFNTLAFSGGGSSKTGAAWETKETGKLEFKGGAFAMEAGKLEGAIGIAGTGTVQLDGANASGALFQIAGGTLSMLTSTTIDSLTLSGGTLTGAATVKVSKTFSWAKASTMSGSGATVLLPGATGSQTSVNETTNLKQREFLNEGTFTHSNGRISLAEGAVLRNAGTYNSNTGYEDAMLAGTGISEVVNTGTFQKTANINNVIAPAFENKGTVLAKFNTLAFSGGGSSKTGAAWETKETGKLEFKGGTFTLNGGSFSGAIDFGGSKTTINLEGANLESIKLSIGAATLNVGPGTSTIGELHMGSGMKLTGPGTLEINEELGWEGTSTMSGSGSTVILPGAVASMTGANEIIYFKEREFVNKGTFTHQNGQIELSEGSVLKNVGTFNSSSGYETSILAGSGASTVVNTGTFQKEEDIENTIEPPFENYGSVIAKVEKIGFAGGGVSGASSLWQANSGAQLEFSGGSFPMAGGSLVGDVAISGSATSMELEGIDVEAADFEVVDGFLGLASGTAIATALTIGQGGTFGTPGTFRVDGLTMQDGALLTGSGTVRVGEGFSWEEEGTMSGAGETILLPGTVSSQTSVNEITRIKEREFVNEGTFTHQNGQIELSDGAILKNRGTFNSNSGWEVSILNGSGGGGTVVNTGTFQKTEDIDNTIEPPFKNYGKVLEKTSERLIIANPVTIEKSEEFGQRSQCADPVDCATGNFAESQTDVRIPGLGIPLEMTRTYSAQAAVAAISPGAFGYGWSSSFSDRLLIGGGGTEVTLIEASGSTVPFTSSGGSAYAAPSWSQDLLTGSPETGYTLVAASQAKSTFSPTGRLQSVEDRNGNKTSLGYDELGRLEEITDPSGRQLVLTYDGGGQVESIEDPMGNLIEYAYESGHLATVTMPGEESPRWQFDYDGDHRITEMIDGRGGETTNEYDASDRVISQTDPAERTYEFEYAPFHTTVTNLATGTITDQWFTTNNQPNSVTYAFGTASARTETFEYDDGGRLVAKTDPAGRTTTFGYNAAGDRTSMKNPAGEETKWTYNGTHDLLTVTEPGGLTTTISRDPAGNPESISRPAPGGGTQTTSFEYGEDGKLESLTDPLERTWDYAYNPNGDLTSEASPEGDEQTWSYDENSRMTASVSPLGNEEGAEPAEYTTTFDVDAQGRVEKVIDPLGHIVEYGYDGNGNVDEKTDPNGNTTTYFYNAVNEPVKTEEPNGDTSEAEYNGEGQVVSQTNGNEETTSYVRNDLGQVVEEIDPLERKRSYEYDLAGNLETVVDEAGGETTYAYDGEDRVSAIDYSSPGTADVSFEYNLDGDVVEMVDGSGESVFDYDSLGRLVKAEDGHGDVVEYDYNLADEQTGITYPNGKSVTRAFDKAGRLTSVSDWLEGKTTFAYDADSNLEEVVFPAGTSRRDRFRYDAAGMVSDVSFEDGGEPLAAIEYVRDKAAQIEAVTNAGLPGAAEQEFGYDENGRLTESSAGSYDYDAAGYLVETPTVSNTFTAAGELEEGGGVAYEYSDMGERLVADPESGPSTTYAYDQAGGLTSVQRAAEGEAPAVSEEFTYDGTRLATSHSSGESTRYLTWDVSGGPPLLLAEGGASYVYGPGGLPIARIDSEETPTYYHHDQLGSTRMLSDASGEPVASFSFDPYGTLEASTGAASTPFGYVGQYTAAGSGFQYLRARFYDPATAQFLTEDPLAAVTGEPYGYGAGNPLSNVDRTGLGPCVLGFIACDEEDDPCDSLMTGPMLPACLIPDEAAPVVRDTSAGVGDSLLSVVPGTDPGPWLRDQFDINNVNECSAAYRFSKGFTDWASMTKGITTAADKAGRHIPDIVKAGRDMARRQNERTVHLPPEIMP